VRRVAVHSQSRTAAMVVAGLPWAQIPSLGGPVPKCRGAAKIQE
jgi:hypothetical protein